MNEINEKSTLLDEYQNIIGNYKKALEEKKVLLNKQKEEMDAIAEKYRLPLINAEQNIKNNLQSVHDFNDTLISYSTFNELMISNAICLLIHIVEEENFQYQSARYYIGYLRYSLWGGQGDEDFNLMNVRMIINAKKRKEEYYCSYDKKDEVTELVKSGNAILLRKVYHPQNKDNISFYSLDDNNNISCASDFGKFDYVVNVNIKT